MNRPERRCEAYPDHQPLVGRSLSFEDGGHYRRLDYGTHCAYSPCRVRPIAAGEHPSAVAKHDKPTRVPVDADLVDRPGTPDVGVATENLLDAFLALLEKLY